ncbi:CUB and zona pellucida-like domain-containing protein 1 isoform X1 [Branchiostoma floridae]|uniref:CUB and zona pellucida-like domain-containing protein 1 isoform X1 n=1 Tax=Branchiostoma floridae TaxID=7739 RepID=A0A9J7MQB3_BRAFL|nr:CUB and zona pellucida-like domain-containing protein 1 isoform X1 [Branchiostoma floridae]
MDNTPWTAFLLAGTLAVFVEGRIDVLDGHVDVGTPLVQTLTENVEAQKDRFVQELSNMVSVQCKRNTMDVVIMLSPLTENYNFEFRDASCRAVRDVHHFLLQTRHDECGTRKEIRSAEHVKYSNELQAYSTTDPGRLDNAGPLQITRTPDWTVNIRVECYYNMSQVQTADFGVYEGEADLLKHGLSSIGFQLEIFDNPDFYKENSNKIFVPLGAPLYLQASFAPEFSDPDLMVFTESCWATPMGLGEGSNGRYTILEDGCPIDDTVTFLPSSPDRYRFSLDSFKFVPNVKEVNIHCSIMACDALDTSSRCHRGCHGDVQEDTPMGRGNTPMEESYIEDDDDEDESDYTGGDFMHRRLMSVDTSVVFVEEDEDAAGTDHSDNLQELYEAKMRAATEVSMPPLEDRIPKPQAPDVTSQSPESSTDAAQPQDSSVSLLTTLLAVVLAVGAYAILVPRLSRHTGNPRVRRKLSPGYTHGTGRSRVREDEGYGSPGGYFSDSDDE